LSSNVKISCVFLMSEFLSMAPYSYYPRIIGSRMFFL
jgi:hypothetical protein